MFMPNIYLRLPSSRCLFFRHRDPNKSLANNEPLIFNAYTPEYFVLRNHLTNADAVMQRVNPQCYSHQQWLNFTHGRGPLGGNVVLKRDVQDYPTFGEIQIMSGRRDYDKSVNEDYLCIKLPREVEVIDVCRVVTPTWNLDTTGVRKLIILLNNQFKRSVLEWALSTFDFCIEQERIVCREQNAMLERFLMRYNIEPSNAEKDNLRRVIERWFKQEHCNFRAYSCFDMQYIDTSEKKASVKRFIWN